MTRNSENIISRHDCSTLLTTFTVQSNFVIVLTYLSQLTERLLFLCFVITMYTYPSLSPTATYCTTVLEKNNKFIFYTRSTTILRYNNTSRKPSPLKFSPVKKNFLVFVAKCQDKLKGLDQLTPSKLHMQSIARMPRGAKTSFRVNFLA